MRLIVMTFTTLLVAAITGFGSAWLALREQPPTGAVQLGQWRAWPSTGGIAIDPYARAIVQRTGALPFGTGEGVELIADRDSDDQPLTGNCAYEIAGPTPEARIWTLTATPADAKISSHHEQSSSLTSDGLLRDSSGAMRITVSAAPSSGEWLPVAPGAPFRLTLRLYDSPTGFTTRPRVAGQVTPTIRRRSCQ